MTYFAQGDCLIKPDTIPTSAKPFPGNALVTGGSGGNTHRAIGPAVSLFKDGETVFVRATESFDVDHPEHKAFTVPAGDYRIDGLMEYDHVAEEARRVED